jgi:NAD(P)-dependent dehydrogenase (short-subunit alcohol dehydrogenase family)
MPAIALVAAGARLGLSLGRVFGGHGFDVALIGRSPARLEEHVEKLAADGIAAAGFPADVTDRGALTAALDGAAKRFGRIDVLNYSAPVGGSSADVRSTGALDVTVDNLAPQIDSICFGAITATRAVLPAMLAAGSGTVLFTTGASAVMPVPVFVSAGMAGAALHNWARTLNVALAGRGVFVGHVAIGVWIAGTPGAPDGVSFTDPDELARRYWDLHARRDTTECLISA